MGDAALAGLQPTTASAAQHAVAAAARHAVPRSGGENLAYARVDLIPGPQSEPRLLELELELELELVEPSPFLTYAPLAPLTQLAVAVAATARGAWP